LTSFFELSVGLVEHGFPQPRRIRDVSERSLVPRKRRARLVARVLEVFQDSFAETALRALSQAHDAATHEDVPDEVNPSRRSFDRKDLNVRFDLQVEVYPEVFGDKPRELHQFFLVAAQDQEIVAVPHVMAETEALDVLVERRDREVGEKLAEVVPDRKTRRVAVDDGIGEPQSLRVFHLPAKPALELVVLDGRIAFPHIALERVDRLVVSVLHDEAAEGQDGLSRAASAEPGESIADVGTDEVDANRSHEGVLDDVVPELRVPVDDALLAALVDDLDPVGSRTPRVVPQLLAQSVNVLVEVFLEVLHALALRLALAGFLHVELLHLRLVYKLFEQVSVSFHCVKFPRCVDDPARSNGVV